MMEINIRSLVSSTALSRSFGKYLKAAEKKPIFIIKNNEVKGVLLNIDTYKELVDTYECMHDTKLARKIFEQPTVNPQDKNVFEIIGEIEAGDNVPD
ncbi:MAG: type II toxin-antitoxin system Phd/YefM family antitoxin [Clostridia bacterium]|nr:type II toxin-antitoxin system Phd/YefM family antitoxin [Clostridia bacterium]